MIDVKKPTLLLDATRARLNIRRMAEKSRRLGLRFRPHFKTHQSRAIGRMFREAGVGAITVSSVDMARYFAADGWRDILIAFPVNVREVGDIRALAGAVHLGLLVESPEAVRRLAGPWPGPVDVWIKVDVGYNRAGVAWDDFDLAGAVALEISTTAPLRLKGLLTHNGQTYRARTAAELGVVHDAALKRLRAVREALAGRGFGGLEISVGDTPSARRLEDFPGVDELRPGNFVLMDAMQLELGTCAEDEIAAAVACPVVAVHSNRGEAVIYGGGIQLSKESLVTRDAEEIFGRICLPEGDGWGPLLPGSAVTSVSQEHGIVRTTPDILARLGVGDLLVVLPVHSCMTVNLWPEFLALDGARFATMRGWEEAPRPAE